MLMEPLLDVNSATRQLVATGRYQALNDKEAQLSEIWRLRQLHYSWLRALMGAYVPFWQCTQDALDFALAQTGLSGDPDLRAIYYSFIVTLMLMMMVLQYLRRYRMYHVLSCQMAIMRCSKRLSITQLAPLLMPAVLSVGRCGYLQASASGLPNGM